jgi:hypothetical protein
MDGPNRAAHALRSHEVWWDLTYPDAVLAQAAELATRQAGDLAALERVLNEPTMILERGVRVPPFVVAYRRAGRWGVRHA